MKTKYLNSLPALGLASVLLWVGFMKFTDYEAQAIKGLIQNSPLISWMYSVFSVGLTAKLIGFSEVVTAILLLLRPFNPKASFLGGVLATSTFALTVTFLFSTPGVWEQSLGGFPALSVMPGQFLVKDIVLLSVSIWVALTSYNEIKK
jgi:uncharacterized membrane protein YkgB